METLITSMLVKHGDLLCVIVAFAFLYVKVNALADKVNDVYRNQIDHWKFHLCSTDKKGE